MRPVNLLPATAPPAQAASGGKSNSSYIVLGVLAALVIAVLGYVLTLELRSLRATTRSRPPRPSRPTPRRRLRAPELRHLRHRRPDARRLRGQLAIGRFDYERLMRELAHVLPTDVWLTGFDAEAGSGLDAAAPSAAAASTGATTPHRPCTPAAPRRSTQVATTLVRLREIQGSDEVDLASSSKTLGQASGGDASSGCGTGYVFDITVNLAPVTVTGLGDAGQKVPVALGGGS